MKYSIAFVLCFMCNIALSQNTLGLPKVSNFSKFQYNGGLQSWDIEQDLNGIIYFANNEGLLSYDGVYWKMTPLPNKTIVRSVYIDKTNKIYVGGQDELGYFSAAANGRLEFYSLLPKIPEKDRKFGDVWDIIALNEEIFIRTDKKIFKLNAQGFSTYNAITEWRFLGKYKNKIVAQDLNYGLFTLDNNPIQSNTPILKLEFKDDITSIVENEKIDQPILTTIKSGIYFFANGKLVPINTLPFLKQERIYKTTIIDKETIALATNYNGIYIVDFNGTVKQHFSKTEGLQNNNVLSLFADSQKNIWLGLDNGIDFIDYNSAIKQIDPNLQNTSAYTAAIKGNDFYIGTSNGLFATKVQNFEDLSFNIGKFAMVPNSVGQVWSLTEVNNQLLMGHHEGAFVVSNSNVTHLPNSKGFWNFAPFLDTLHKNRIISGTYQGLSLITNANNSLQVLDTIPNFDESSRYVTVNNDGVIWVSHPYHGVFKLEEKNGNYKIETYTEKNGLPSTLNNHVFKLKNETVIATTKGMYIYQKDKNNFIASPFYQNIFGNLSLRYLKEDNQGNIWFISEKQIGVVNLANDKKTLQYFPELSNRLLSGFEFIYPFNNNNVLVGGATGLYNINFQKYKSNSAKLPILIRNVSIVNGIDSTLYGGNTSVENSKTESPDIASNWKLIRFQFASSSYGNQSNIEYSYRLVGFDKNWSEWAKRTEKEYTNLPAGDYTFEVKVRNNLGIESEVSTYSFTMLPPWYLSIWAYLFYTICLAAIFYFLYKWQQKKFIAQQKKYDEEQQKLRYIHELEQNKKESEIIALQNEKLESDISFQNAELASAAMHLVKKGELIAKLKEDLAQLTKGAESVKVTSEIKRITKTLNEDENMDKEWEQFSKHFDKVHSNFLAALKEKHTTITPSELKLSAYLRMNLTTKEIAQLINISVRGVEISRYRLRKKLNLEGDMTLFDYLITI